MCLHMIIEADETHFKEYRGVEWFSDEEVEKYLNEN